MIEQKIEEIEEAVLRIHEHLRKFEGRENCFTDLMGKLRDDKSSKLKKEDKEQVLKWGEYKYYEGKLMAYLFVLKDLGREQVPTVIERLRGFQYEGATVKQTKKGFHYPIPRAGVLYVGNK